MSILIFILKLMGILLLLLLFLLALFLFHPIFYRIEGEIEEKTSVQGYFWWLFQILRLEFYLTDGKVKWKFRFFGVSKEFGAEDWEGETPFKDEPDCIETHGKTERKEERAAEIEEGREVSHGTAPRPKKSGKPKKASKEKPSQKKEKKTGKSGFSRMKEEFTDSGNRQAVKHLWREFCFLLSHLKPRHLKAELSFSTGDPAATGEVTGALALIPAVYRCGVHIYPDFLSEEWYVRGSFGMRGHMALVQTLRVLFRLIRDKNLRRLYYKLRK